jgi:hypothetical protein
MHYKKLWIAFGLVMVVSFSVLGGVGYKAINNGPPIPAKVVTTDGQMLFTGETIRDGRMSGSPPVDRKSVRSGDMELMLRPTGAPIISIANQRLC